MPCKGWVQQAFEPRLLACLIELIERARRYIRRMQAPALNRVGPDPASGLYRIWNLRSRVQPQGIRRSLTHALRALQYLLDTSSIRADPVGNIKQPRMFP